MTNAISSVRQDAPAIGAPKRAGGDAGSAKAPDAGAKLNDSSQISAPDDGPVHIPNFQSWANELGHADSMPSNVQERTNVSTAYVAPAETRESTSPDLNISKTDGRQADAAVNAELGHQEQAQAESKRRSDQAQGVLDSLGGSQRLLEGERSDADDQKAARRRRTEAGEKNVQTGEDRLQSDSAQIENIKTAGEQAMEQHQSTERLVQQTDQDFSQVSNQVQETAQEVKVAEQKVQEAQQMPEKSGPPGQEKKGEPASGTPGESSSGPPGQAKKQSAPAAEASAGPGKGNGKGKGAPAPPASSKPAEPSSKPASPSAAKDGPPRHKKGEPQKKAAETRQATQQRAEQARTRQVAAQQRQKNLEAKQNQLKQSSERQRWGVDEARFRLDEAQASRRRGGEALQATRVSLQNDVDALRDLGNKTQSIHSQLEELKAGFAQSAKSRAGNAANADTAQRNVDHLKGMRVKLARDTQEREAAKTVSPSTTAGAAPAGRARHGDGSEGILARPVDQGPTQSAQSTQGAAPGSAPSNNQNGFTTHETEDNTNLRLLTLNDGLGAGNGDVGQALGKSQGRVADGEKFNSADLAAQATNSQTQATNPGSEANLGSSSTPTSSGPGNSDFGHSRGNGHGNGKGKG